jgi:hypothetical protein
MNKYDTPQTDLSLSAYEGPARLYSERLKLKIQMDISSKQDYLTQYLPPSAKVKLVEQEEKWPPSGWGPSGFYKWDFPSSVVDELLNAHPEYHFFYYPKASVEQVMDKLGKDIRAFLGESSKD